MARPGIYSPVLPLMKKTGLILLVLTLLPLAAWSQVEGLYTPPPDSVSLVIDRMDDGSKPGKIILNQDPRLTSVLRKHAAFNKSHGYSGWAILIYKGREIARANQARAEFENLYAQMNLPVEVQYNEPDFSTLAGFFRNKEDAFRFKKQIEVTFTQAYLVRTRILQD